MSPVLAGGLPEVPSFLRNGLSEDQVAAFDGFVRSNVEPLR